MTSTSILPPLSHNSTQITLKSLDSGNVSALIYLPEKRFQYTILRLPERADPKEHKRKLAYLDLDKPRMILLNREEISNI